RPTRKTRSRTRGSGTSSGVSTPAASEPTATRKTPERRGLRGRVRPARSAGEGGLDADVEVRLHVAHAVGAAGDANRQILLFLGGDGAGQEDDPLARVDVDVTRLDDRVVAEIVLHRHRDRVIVDRRRQRTVAHAMRGVACVLAGADGDEIVDL